MDDSDYGLLPRGIQMSDGVVIALITAGTSVVLQLLSLIRIEKIHKATNSMHDAIVKTSGDARFAEGRESGRAESKVDITK